MCHNLVDVYRNATAQSILSNTNFTVQLNSKYNNNNNGRNGNYFTWLATPNKGDAHGL